jgi:hypothetical protein
VKEEDDSDATADPDYEPGWDRDPRRPRDAAPMGATQKRLLRVGVALGIAMVVVPIVVAAVGIGTASRVPEGLRGATHLPEMKDKVSFAFGSTMLVPFFVLPGVLLGVSCALALAGEKKKGAR